MPRSRRLHGALDRRFEAVVFDWDGTAVPDRQADAGALRELVEQLCALGVDLGVVTGTNLDNVDGQLGARPPGPGRLYLCVNRGSEVFRADDDGVHLLGRRTATAEEDEALDAAAQATVAALGERGLRAEVVSQRLNRRKVDLVPEPEWADPPKARIAELLDAVEARLHDAGLSGLHEVVELAEQAARAAGLDDPRVTSDAKHVEIGLTDKSDSAGWLFTELARTGTGPGLVLVAGDEFGTLGGLPGSDSLLLVPEGARATAVSVGAEPTGVPPDVVALGGGPDRFLDLLAAQLERRRDVPQVDADPAWTLAIEGVDAELERVHASLRTLADGRVGTRGAPLLAHPAAEPGVLAADLFSGEGPDTELVHAPDWTRLPGRLPDDPQLFRRLDLRRGVLRHDGPLAALQLSSLRRPGTVAMRVQGDGRRLPPARRRVEGEPGEVFVLALDDERDDRRLERIGVYGSDEPTALRGLDEAREAGFEALLAEHRHAWASRWEHADVVVEGDPELQLAVRFALFHLMASVTDDGEAAVGARGLSGSGYRGHVFWDSDVFILPFLAATHPPAARAMLEYRVRRLDAARAAAARDEHAGARFPWESAAEGDDVTPSHAHLPTGEIVRIRTGEAEEHITADVAWAAACYLEWTGDEEFAAGPGRELLVETARYWASRVRFSDGRAHLYGTIGPDEYHEPVDDNAFTNVMARWNLRAAARLTDDDAERRAWLRIAGALVDGYDAMSGLYEQFAGFFRLEPLVIADVAPRRPIAADLLLGPERTAGAQVLKQADVLMLHHLVPDEVAPGSLLPNLDFYEPRTAHGSSLSPAVHASLLARAGRFREALRALRIAARIDLDDLTTSTASGLHLATMGGLWQALAFGFAGVRPRGDRLVVDPRLPTEWGALELRLQYRGLPLRLRIHRGGVDLEAPDTLELHRRDSFWEVSFR